jgi:lipoprotein-releasing system ATP-binding protein
MSFVTVTALNKRYQVGAQTIHVLRDLELRVEEGEMVAVVGASGVGKSTLLHLLGGLDRPDGGTIAIGEVAVTGLADRELVAFRNRHVGFVFQFHHLLPEFSAVENAEMPLRIARVPLAAARPRAVQLLERVGLGERLTHRPGMLSGGEQQRVAVARALVTKPALLLADEPTGDLDEDTADALHRLLRDMHREHGLTSVIATHNPRLAAACDRVLRLETGRLVPA